MAQASRGIGPGLLPISYLRRPQSTCPKCGRSLHAGSLARTCKRRDCPGYVGVWMGDQRVRLLENLLAYGGLTCMLTLTAPGADALPWDEQACAHLGQHRHSGTRGCRVEATALRRFNEGSMRAWSALWNVVRSRVNRDHGTGASSLLAYAPEPQQRGAIHFHIVFGAGSPRERAALDDIARDLATIGAGYGWGRVHRPEADDVGTRPDGRTANGLALYEAARAACYLSKYLSGEAKSGVRELVVSGQAPRRAVYVATRLTMRTRCTMRNLRTRRYAYMVDRVRLPMPEVESWLRDYKLRCMWSYCQRHPSTLWAQLVAEHE